MRRNVYIDELIAIADNLPYMDYCRLMAVLNWNL
uniref:Uncharacterized protein n=1 Tax=Siphoviridae sp. ctr8v12 TaxID=2825685 RepID=A0A8S5QGT7_9CAUD|nr:MAG TPA: hypothetical protein [Siphoviridae sp. ctr8v12]